MTRAELISAENACASALAALDRFPVLALQHARTAKAVLDRMLHEPVPEITEPDVAATVPGLKWPLKYE